MANQMIQRVIVLIGMLAVSASPALAEERTRFAPDAEIRSAFNEVVSDARDSVVQLVVDGEERILGTIPVEPDGSAYFRVPAGLNISFLALDAEGRAVQRMRSFA